MFVSKPKTIVERLLWAYQFGHAWNRSPDYANLRNLDWGRILKMNGDEEDAKLLIASFQDFDPQVERHVLLFHGRALQPDGIVGPATEAAMNIKRCGMPDFAPPAGAELSVIYEGLPGLRGAAESYQKYAAAMNNDAEYVGGTGSWPGPKKGGGCDPLRKDVHSTRVNVIRSGFSEHQRSLMSEVLPAVERCEAEIGQHVRHILDGDPANCEHDIRGENMPGGVIGYNYFPDPDTCDQVLVGRIDNTFNADKYTLAELNQHEYKGHGDGAEHVNRQASNPGEDGYSIMHPSIGNPKRWPSWLKDRTYPKKRQWFGGIPLPSPEPEPPPTPTPGPSPPVAIDEFIISSPGTYQIVRKSSGPVPGPGPVPT